MEVSGQFHAPAALLSGEKTLYALNRRLGGPQSRSGHGGEEKNSQPHRESNPIIIIIIIIIIICLSSWGNNVD
jgi:hypothetical protein